MNTRSGKLVGDRTAIAPGRRRVPLPGVWPVTVGILSAWLLLGTEPALPHDDADDSAEVAGHGSGMSAGQLRQFIAGQVGGIGTLQVPDDNADLPQPLLADGSPDPFFETTEEKRFLGKMLFHDPGRTARIRPEFGGSLETFGTASCGSCHFGAAASKAGAQFNFAVGGEGIGYTDADGEFIVRRRARVDILPPLRTQPLFEGDELVDSLPTLTDVYEFAIGSPARGRKLPDPGLLLATGRLDAVDSVARNAPSVIGAAFNNRLLLDGFAGEPDSAVGGLNPFGHPAQENVTLLLLDAHRMLEAQSAVLQLIPAYVELFREAFPEEAAQYDVSGDINDLINDVTVFRATASYLRTVVTRNTPWDRFLAGDNRALTAAQRRGARLFFTEAKGGKGGAGCFGCHSGPMLNKQVDDPDVAGVGEFIEQNFYNLGLADHPRQALNRAIRNDPSFRDEGRREITGEITDAFKFRTLTLRQLRDARTFMHNGSFTSVQQVVEYFNAGIPQDAEAGASPTMTWRFTHPRGRGTPRGLGLSRRDVRDLSDFIENALYDPAFAEFDPESSTDLFQLSERDLTYSVYRPQLAAAGANDGWVLSGRAPDNDDPLSRRDLGLEFLDVGNAIDTRRVFRWRPGNRQLDVVQLSNNSSSVVDTHLLVVVEGLPATVELLNSSGVTSGGDPYLRLFLDDGVLRPGESILAPLRFRQKAKGPAVEYRLALLSGQGEP